MRPSLQHVADRAKVSRMTVSNVLRDGGARVNSEKRERVLQAVRDLGYIPVAGPTSQKRQVQTRTLSIVLEGIRLGPKSVGVAGFGGETFGGMINAAENLHYDLLTLLRPLSSWQVEREEMRFLDRRSDGLLLISDTLLKHQQLLEKLVAHDFPIVACYGSDGPKGIGHVGVDNVLAMRQAVGCLARSGHRAIAFVDGPDGWSSFRERRQGFIQAMKEHGLSVNKHSLLKAEQLPFKDEVSLKWLVQLKATAATAVVCANDMIALRLQKAALEQGLSIPKDLSIIGVDDLPESTETSLTSIKLPAVEVGAAAVELLVRGIQALEKDVLSERILLPTVLIERRSVGKPRQKHLPASRIASASH